MVNLSHKSDGRSERYSPILTNTCINNSKLSNTCSTKYNRELNRNPNYEVKPNYKFNYSSSRYIRKLPINFVSSKDWSFYLHFMNKFNNPHKKKPNNRVYRLLGSFLKLYQEYSYVCDNILPSFMNYPNEATMYSKVSNENNKNHVHNFDDYTQEADMSRLLYPPNCSNFHDHVICPNLMTDNKCPVNSENRTLKRWFLKKFHHAKINSSNSTHPYDKICRYQHETIEIFSNEKLQRVISHRINFTGFDAMGRPKIKWIQVPIALELLIPKIQHKIQRIMMTCNFLYDPLEVAAELRFFNYNVDMCTNHFQRTKKFRDILEEFLPQKSQLKELELQPQLWEKFKCFLDKMETENGNYLFNNDASFPTTKISNNKSNKNTSSMNYLELPMNKGAILLNEKGKETSVLQAKLIKVVCSIEKLKLTKSEIQQLLIRSQVKYKKQIDEYSSKISRVVEYFKDFLMTDEQRGRVIHLLKQNDELKIKLKDEEKKRKTIYNMMQDQLGNVRVYCRCRAFEKNHSVLDIKTNDTVMMQTGFFEEYKFDKVFEPFRSQAAIYEEFQPLIMSFIDGFNVCFITYGGEASGKTYTLLGATLSSPSCKDNDKHDGVMKRALKEVLAEQSARKRDWEYRLNACVVEIYNDTFIDLLTGDTGIHLPIDRGLEKVQASLKSVPVNCDADIEALIKVCKLKRRVGKTALNPQSSRSHLITMIHLTGRSKIHGETISSFLAMCDLAGFEDILKAETHNNLTLSKEAGYINKSLTAFNRVFTSLRRQDPNTVSYRDTKLTYLLKPFLTNQGKCVLIVTVRTDKSSISSTQSTLRFGRESRGVALGKAKRQANLDKIIF